MSVIGRLFGLGADAPKMAPMIAPPTGSMTPQVDAGAQAARDRQRALMGMSGTVMTGGLGEEGTPNKTRKTLLGQ